MNNIIDKNPFEEDDFDIEYDEDFDDPSLFSDQDLIELGVESDRISEIRANWAKKAEPKTIETDAVEAKEEAEESNNKISFTYCTTKCDKKVFEYKPWETERQHNLYLCHMDNPWWSQFTGTAEDVFKLSTTGHTIIPCTFNGAKRFTPEEGKETGEFIQSQLILLDYDDGHETPQQKIKALEEAGINVNFWNGSFSYNPPEKLKYRIVIKLDRPIIVADDYRQIARYLVREFGYDLKPVAPNSYFYGGKGDGEYFNDGTTSVDLLLGKANAYFAKSKSKKNKANKPSIRREASPIDLTHLNSQSLRQLIEIAKLLAPSHPWRLIAIDNEWLSHDAIFAVSASLCKIDGGANYMRDYLDQWEYPSLNQLESKINFIDEFEAGTRDAKGYFTYVAIDSGKEFSLNGDFDKNDANCWDLLTLLDKFNKTLRFASGGLMGYGEEWDVSSSDFVDVEFGTENESTCRVYISGSQNHPKNDKSLDGGNNTTISNPTQLCVVGINDFFQKHSKQSSQRSVKEKLQNIVTAKTVDYDNLLQLQLFKDFIEGKQLDGVGTASEDKNYLLHKELVFGLFSLTERIEKDGERIRVGKFINEVAKSLEHYTDKKRSGNVRLVAEIISNVNGAIRSNKNKYGVAKCLPVNDNDCIYHAYQQLKLRQKEEAIQKKKAETIFTPDPTVFDTVENNRAWLNAEERALVNLSKAINVIECCTGLGKGRWAINQIKASPDQTCKMRKVVCAPSHELKNSIKNDWLEQGLVEDVDFVVTPNIKDYIPPGSSSYVSIEQDYQRGLYAEVKKKLRELPLESEYYAQAQEYLNKDDAVKDFPGAILTTHAKLFNAHTVREDRTISDYFEGRDEIIIDEDPTDTLFDVIEIGFNDIELAITQLKAWGDKSNNDENWNKHTTTIAFLQDILDSAKKLRQDYYNSVANDSSKINKSLIPHFHELDSALYSSRLIYSAVREVTGIKGKVADIGNKQIMLYTGRDDSISLGRIRPLNFDSKKVVITSATPNMEAIKGAFGAANVIHHQCKLTTTKGKIFWVNTKGTSKSGMQKDQGLSDRWEGIVKSTNTEVVVSCKSFKQEIKELIQENKQTVLHYPTPGVNTVKGKSIACLGQYIENDYSILMKALLLGHRPETIAKNNIGGFRTRDGRNYKAYTFVDKFMAELDIYAYNSTLRQALGRARLIDNAVTAFFISNKPIEACEKITLEQFFNMVKVSVDGNSTTLNNRLNQTESKRLMYSFGLINEDGELTAKGRKSIKNHC